MNILHITDLHIGDKNNVNDYLREGFYRDYIDGLFTKIDTQLDYLFVSGDYINAIDKTSRDKKFEHASTIIEYIQTKFNIPKDKTFLCAGNHDIDIDKEKEEKYQDAREDYSKFSIKHTKKPLGVSDFVSLYKSDDIFILTLDATFKSKGNVKPGVLDVNDIDECIKVLRDNNVDAISTLIIITHFPFIEISGTISAIEEIGWDDKHLWKSAFPLRKRIEALRNPEKQNTFVFFGDIHFPYTNTNNGITYFSAGRLGTDIFTPSISKPESLSMLPRQARIYQINENSIECKTASWNPLSHHENPHTGEWEINSSTTKLKEIISEPLPEVPENTKKLIVFSEITEQRIIQLVTNQNLYRFGRFNTAHDDNVSLAWILINKLLNNQSLLCDIIDNMKEWIFSNNLIAKDCILFGVDCWGNVISSQLSSITNIPNYCTVSRAEGKYHSDDELLCPEIKADLIKYKNVIIVTDVVATGHGTDFIFKSIKSHCSEHVNFYIFSILADETQNHFLTENYTHVTSCAKLRIPIINKNKLPSEEILPSIIAFK